MDKLGKVNGFVRINMSLIDDANLASLIKLFFRMRRFTLAL